ncbi:flagellar protein FliT [Clostridium sp.]|uniref:flagellar protein FliT n=1 Tax=Clostridium sp. TaxID=1506 RepID=UPI00283DE4BF|nr:flagellar protein FliT [Clostridium sp.]MDR3593985.1 flagellar protein FliT [Clostridium sp.]
MNLEENFIKYKDITLTIIEAVKSEEYELLDEIFQQRQLILDNINKINHSKEELKKLYLKYDIDKLDKTLASEMKVKRQYLLEKMKENKKRQVAMNGYKNLSAKAVFLSRKF